MIKIVQTGNYSRVTQYLKKLTDFKRMKILEKYGEKGVAALSAATPRDTGKTAESWTYTITYSSDVSIIEFSNSNRNKGVPIALILQYGHGTGTGGYVQGRDYINPAIQPIFDEMVEHAWGEVTKV